MDRPRPLGEPIPDMQISFPKREVLDGQHVKLLPMRFEHADQLFQTVGGSAHAALYDYMPYGPFEDDSIGAFRELVNGFAESKDPQFYSIHSVESGKLVGWLSFLRIDVKHRVIEIGHIMYSPTLQRTTPATEAWYLLANKAFRDGFRRLEWKCNNLNSGSKRAAERFGHTFEGVFRQHMIVDGRNRDSAWFSILDGEWPSRSLALQKWMDPQNFDDDGRQKQDLMSLRESLSDGAS